MRKMLVIFFILVIGGAFFITFIHRMPKSYVDELPESRQLSIPEGETIIVTDPVEINKLKNDIVINPPEGVVIEKVELEYYTSR